MKTKHYLITAVVTYLTFLIYLAPAAPVINLLIEDNKYISVSSASGSLWSGNVKSILVKQHEIRDVDFSFSPLRLVMGEVCFDIEALYKNTPISASIGLSLTGKRILHNLNTTIDAYLVGMIIDIPIGELGGDLNIKIDDASWTADTVPNITGDILWQKAAYIVAEKTELGDLTVIFSEDDTSPLIAMIQNTPGHLSVDGSFIVNEEGHYDLGITLKPTQNASTNLQKSLKLFAKPLSDGSFEINNAGELSTFGLM